ncbi:MAG: outer membrane protein assembly factor BamE [Tepidisphaeraceae bacterium]
MTTRSTNALRHAFIVVLLLSILAVTGCATGRSGRELSAADIQSLHKGVTTRSEVEAKLGPPMSTTMLGDGRRMAMYLFTESTSKARPESFIPVVGLFVGGNDTTQRQQQLQVIYRESGVVEDFEFADTSSTGSMKTNPFGMSADSGAPATK